MITKPYRFHVTESIANASQFSSEKNFGLHQADQHASFSALAAQRSVSIASASAASTDGICVFVFQRRRYDAGRATPKTTTRATTPSGRPTGSRSSSATTARPRAPPTTAATQSAGRSSSAVSIFSSSVEGKAMARLRPSLRRVHCVTLHGTASLSKPQGFTLTLPKPNPGCTFNEQRLIAVAVRRKTSNLHDESRDALAAARHSKQRAN